MKTRCFVLSIVSLLAFGPAFAEEEKKVPASLEELKTLVAETIEEHQVPAVGIAMLDPDGEVWVGSLGKANLENDVPADADTLYRIGSTSKMFVALSVLKLIEQGRLSLDDRLADLAPEIEFENPWEQTDPVRVVHLLEHTTGWDDIHLPEYAHNDPTPVTLKEALDYHPHSRTSRWKPGTRMSYCNSGPPVAAYIVEKLTGLDFEDYVQFNFFDPLGMDSATYRMNDAVLQRGATLYSNNEPQDYWHISMRPSGSINASPRDMARFVRFYLERGRVEDWALVSEDSLERMERSETTSGARAGLQVGYGLHNYSSSHEGWVYREHNGGVNGGLTELAYLPEAGVGHAIMINSDSGTAFREISRLVRAYETRKLETNPVEKTIDLTEADGELEGMYYPINPRAQIGFFMERIFNVQELWISGDRMVRKPMLDGKPAYYFPAGEGRFVSEKTGRVSMVATTDPLAGDVLQHGTTVLKPVSTAQVYLQFLVLLLWGLAIVSSVLFAPVWIVRRIRGKIEPGAAIRVRLWPLLASLSAVGFVMLFMVGMGDPFDLLGGPSLVSVGLLLCSVLFAVFAFLGVVCAVATRHRSINRYAWWHSAIASALSIVVTVYLLMHGAIGIMTWA